jgi:hypothetical protein
LGYIDIASKLCRAEAVRSRQFQKVEVGMAAVQPEVSANVYRSQGRRCGRVGRVPAIEARNRDDVMPATQGRA